MQTTVPVATQSFGDTVRASLSDALSMAFASIPRLLAFLVILLVGWFVASLLARGIAALLRTVQFNDFADRAGISGFVRRMGVESDPAGVLAVIAKWFVRLIALVVAFDALGLPAVSLVLQQFLLWIPNLVVALVLLVVTGVAARALGNLARGASSEAGFTNPDMLATVARVGVWAIGVAIAINQIGIATDLINILVTGVVAALALASGLAFGLGGREKAASWLDRASRASGQFAHGATSAAGNPARRPARERPWDAPVTPIPMRADRPERDE